MWDMGNGAGICVGLNEQDVVLPACDARHASKMEQRLEFCHRGSPTSDAGCTQKRPVRCLHGPVAVPPRDGACDVRVSAAVLAVRPRGKVWAPPHTLVHSSGCLPGAVLREVGAKRKRRGKVMYNLYFSSLFKEAELHLTGLKAGMPEKHKRFHTSQIDRIGKEPAD